MKKTLLMLAILCHLSLLAIAQNSDIQIRQKISHAATIMKTMQCDFEQKKYIKLLNHEMVSKGKLYYQQAACLRWEYITPYTYTFILNQDKVLLKNNKRNDVLDVKQNKMFSEIVNIMMSSVVGNCLTDNKNFHSNISVAGNEWVVTLQPLRREVKQMFPRIVLHFNQKLAVVTQIELFEKSGDKTMINLKNIKKNEKISADMFSIH